MEFFLLELDEIWRDFNQVFLSELIMLCLIMIVGFYVMYTDVRFRDIPNLAVWGLLGAGVLGQLFFWWLDQTNITQIFIVFFASFGVGYLLYLYGFWAPGDAKLFWAMSVAFPPTLCPSWKFFSLHTPLWALLINAVLFNFLFLLFFLLFRRDRLRRSSRSSSFSLKLWLHAGIEVAGLSGLVLGGGVLVRNQPLAFIEALISTMVLYLAWERFVPQAYRLALSFPGLALAIYAMLAPESGLVLLGVWGIAWGIQSVYQLLQVRFGDALVQSLPIDALQAGMVPVMGICASSKRERETGLYICVEQIPGKRPALCRPGVPLQEEEVRKLQEVGKRGSLDSFGNRLPVDSPVPFAPFLVLSVAVTAIIAGNITLPLMPYLRQWLA